MSKNVIMSFAMVATVFAACGDDNGTTNPNPNPGSPDAAPQPTAKTIVGTAAATPTLSTLVAAVTFASDNNDLVTLLDSPGTFTVFAPTNDAFDALAVEITGVAGTKAAALLTPANKPLLRTVLQYHVLKAVVKAADIPFGKAITSAEGSVFKIDSASPPVITDGRNRKSNITATDIVASNGVVHVVDKVILPANKDIVETAQALAAATPGEFKLLVEAVIAADLAATLKGAGPFTVFAPTDAAFGALLTELNITKTALFANKPLLTSVLTYHAVSGRVLKADIVVGTPIQTVQMESFTIDAMLKINDARARKAGIIATDVFAKNGVIHVIDKVILPKP
jgi:uncharacterized surface protein with fasciclin (FAS1) repeats